MKKALGIVLLALLLMGIVPSTVTIPAASAATQANIDAAIENGLAYLNSTQASDGSWGSASDFPVACTAMAVLAFENQGHYGWNASDPYSATVKNGLDWLFANGKNITINNQPAGNPDTNRNGIGLMWGSYDANYQTPMVLMAIIASNAQRNVTTTGPASVIGRTYYDIAVDIVDYLAWGQSEGQSYNGSAYRGGWGYQPNKNYSDNSNSQWPVLGLMAAELWGIKGVDFVKSELQYWTTYSQNLIGTYDTNPFYGSFGYNNPTSINSIAESATGILELTYCGANKTDPRIIAAEGYIDRDWNTNDGVWRVNLGDLYAMYAVMKACRLATPTPIQFIANYTGSPSVEWYNGTGEYADSLLANQSSDGNWTDWVAWNEESEMSVWLTSAWGVLILELVPVRVTYTLTVTVKEAVTLEPIAGAAVQAFGPQNASGNTAEGNGSIVFDSIQAGNYLVDASASGYSSSLNNAVSVTNNTAFTILLSLAVDWWSMFHHDRVHTGYSTSIAPYANSTLWTRTTGSYVGSSPTVVGGVVYVGSNDHNVYALDAMTGAKIWNYTTGSYVSSSPAVAYGVVYVGSYDWNVYALNATTGGQIWNYTTGGYVFSSPTVAEGVVYVGSDDLKVYALNATTGAQIWNYTTGGIVRSSPAAAGGMVYVDSFDDRTVYALNATTGVQIWNYTTGGYVYSSPAVASGVVYVGSYDWNVYALNATTGVQIWNYTTGNAVESSPAVAYGVVYVGSDDLNVYALNATTGVQIWNYTTGGAVYSSPAVAGGVVFVGSADDKVYALNATTGAFIWSYTTGFQVRSSPAVAWGIVYVGSYDNKVYAFGVNHNVVVDKADCFNTVVGQGYSARINVTVANLHNLPEELNVTAYANTTTVASQNVTLPALDAATLTFTWNTTGFAYGNYTVSACAWPVSGEKNMTDSNFTGGWVFVAGVGDLTGGTTNALDFVPDGKVLIEDIAVVAKCFAQKVPPAPANCDVTGPTLTVPDGKIQIDDVATVSKQYGQRYSYP